MAERGALSGRLVGAGLVLAGLAFNPLALAHFSAGSPPGTQAVITVQVLLLVGGGWLWLTGSLPQTAGRFELAGLDESVNLRRVRAIERAARGFLPGLPQTELVEVWGGMRPLTPDDLPLIGRPRNVPGLTIAAGHGMAGMAQGPSTGELVAQLITGEPTALDLSPFSPDRFERARG